jgi:hypothetical protein
MTKPNKLKQRIRPVTVYASTFLVLCAVDITWTRLACDAVPPDPPGKGLYEIGHSQVFHKKSYREKFKDYRTRRIERRSEELMFNAARRQLLNELFFERNRHYNLIDPKMRSALYRKEQLPPGLQKQLTPGQNVPAGLYKKMVTLPPDVSDYLGFRDNKEVRVGVVGDDVLLYNTRSGVILDVMKDFF